MKVEMTIPTEQYGNVRPTIEFPDDYSVEKVAEYTAINYRIFANAFQEQPENTLPEDEMVSFLYGMLYHVPNHIETYELMNPAQKTFINQLKKALARKTPNHKQPQTKKDILDAKGEY